MKKQHESYGMISVSKFASNHSQFFGSDLVQNGGVTIEINTAEKERKYNSEWYQPKSNVISVRLSYNQYVDMITSGMNTVGVPCTIQNVQGKRIEQIDHIENKKEMFQNDMLDTHKEYHKRIDEILSMLDGNNIGKRKAEEIKHEIEVLKGHISGNTNFVMKCFNESMEKAVTEAKHSVSNYIDNKIHTLGIESLREEMKVSIDTNEK
jgi:hypothetical protein